MSNQYVSRQRNRILGLLAVAVLVVLVLVAVISGWIERWLWMRQLDYAGIFWTLFSVQGSDSRKRKRPCSKGTGRNSAKPWKS
jgi:hypothetical protein